MSRPGRLEERGVPVGLAVNPNLACVTPMMLHHDEAEAIRRGIEGANFFGYSLGHFYVFGTHEPGRTNVWAAAASASAITRAARRLSML